MKVPAAHVLLVDANRSRRQLLAIAFRSAGCVVVETGKEQDVTRTLAANKKPWVLAVAGPVLNLSFCDAHPSVPIVQIGGDHREAIAGRITVDTSPHLAAQVHALVSARTGPS